MIQAGAAAKRAGLIALERGGTRLALRDLSTDLVAEFDGANGLLGEVRATGFQLKESRCSSRSSLQLWIMPATGPSMPSCPPVALMD